MMRGTRAAGCRLLLLVSLGILVVPSVPGTSAGDKANARKESPLDSLTADTIPAAERLQNQPPELVAVLRTAVGMNPTFGVAFSPSDDTLASGGVGQPVQLWDVRTQKVAVKIHTDSSALSLAFTADGKHLLFLTGGGRCLVWRTGEQPGNPQVTLKASGRVYQQLAVSNVTHRAAFDTDDGVRVYDVSAMPPRPLLSLSHPDGVLSLAFSGDGKTLVIGTPTTVHVWDTGRVTAKALTTHHHPEGPVNAVAASRDGTTVAGSEGPDIRVYAGGKQTKMITDHKERVIGLSFVGGDAWPLLSADASGRMVLRTEDGKRLMDIKVGSGTEGMAVSHDRRYAATANRDGTVYVFRLPTQK